MTDIDCVNFLPTPLQQAIGKPTSRSANIESQFAVNIDLKEIESAFQLLPAATDIAWRFGHRDQRFKIDQLRRFRDDFLDHLHFSGHHRAFCALAAFEKAALDQQIVDPDSLRHCLDHTIADLITALHECHPEVAAAAEGPRTGSPRIQEPYAYSQLRMRDSSLRSE